MSQEHETENEIKDDVSSEPFGELIRNAREQKELSIKDIANELNLSPTVIECLEEEKFSELPPPLFAKGYIRSVSQYLGLNTDELLSVYNNHGFSEPALTKNAPSFIEKESAINVDSLLKWIKWLLILAVIGVGVWFGVSKWKDSQNTPDEGGLLLTHSESKNNGALALTVTPSSSGNDSSVVLPIQTEQTAQLQSPLLSPVINTQAATDDGNAVVSNTVDADGSNATVSQSLSGQNDVGNETPTSTDTDTQLQTNSEPEDKSNDPNVVASDDKGILINPSEKTWVKVEDASGRVLLSGLLKAKETRRVIGKPPYRLSIGNANKVKVEYNGKVFDHLRYASSNNVSKFNLN